MTKLFDNTNPPVAGTKVRCLENDGACEFAVGSVYLVDDEGIEDDGGHLKRFIAGNWQLYKFEVIEEKTMKTFYELGMSPEVGDVVLFHKHEGALYKDNDPLLEMEFGDECVVTGFDKDTVKMIHFTHVKTGIKARVNNHWLSPVKQPQKSKDEIIEELLDVIDALKTYRERTSSWDKEVKRAEELEREWEGLE